MQGSGIDNPTWTTQALHSQPNTSGAGRNELIAKVPEVRAEELIPHLNFLLIDHLLNGILDDLNI